MCNNRPRGFRAHSHPFHGSPFAHPGKDSFRVPVNIVKNEANYELFVFAPDRIKEDFKVSLKGSELTIRYQLMEEASEKKSWIRHEFQKSSFERSFLIPEPVDADNIVATYTHGILRLILPITPGAEKPETEIKVG